jgi:hypothetical protein
MATQYLPFSPSPVSPPQYTVTLAGVQYNLVVTWNLFGLRYYVNLYLSNGGAWVLTVPATGSEAAAPQNLVAGYIPGATLWFDSVNSQFVAS